MSPFSLPAKIVKRWREKTERIRREEERGSELLKKVISACNGEIYHPICFFSGKELLKATEGSSTIDRFSGKSLRGDYEGCPIYVKSYDLKTPYRQIIAEVLNEVAMVTQINHRNVVKVLGCCLEMENPSLIFEFVPNGSLEDRLSWKNCQSPLSWDDRLRIATEIADVVTYLHIGATRPIVHRDIKCSNILLDESCSPKLSSFKLATIIPLGETHVKDKPIRGTWGYMDPNYINTGDVMETCDVYAFGVVLLELLTGSGAFHRALTADHFVCDHVSLLDFVCNQLENGTRVHRSLDANVSIDAKTMGQVTACIGLALRCCNPEPEGRPAMKEVVLELRQIRNKQSSTASAKGETPEQKSGESFFAEKQKNGVESMAIKVSGKLLQELVQSCDVKVCYPFGVNVLHAKELTKAAKNFSNFIDEGGNGEYYAGTCEGRSVCIKRFRIPGNQQNVMCRALNEFLTVTQISHKCIPKISSYCFDVENPMFVYDFLPSRSLSHHIFRNNNPSPSLSWDDRLRIATEIAYAVSYLHTGTSMPIVHRDLHSGNIMLDECNSPKLCDFSLAITIPMGRTHVMTSVEGTYGFAAPEYVATGSVTEKCDVYCFGMLMLELISGKKVMELLRIVDYGFNLREFFSLNFVKKKKIDLILDPSLPMDARKKEQVKASIKLALDCLANEMGHRPSMKEVALELVQISKYKLLSSPPLG